MNPYEKLPKDIYVKIEKESNIRFEDFFIKNNDIIKKLNEEEISKLKKWINTITSYEYYRKYKITEDEFNEYNKENNIKIREDIPIFKDLT